MLYEKCHCFGVGMCFHIQVDVLSNFVYEHLFLLHVSGSVEEKVDSTLRVLRGHLEFCGKSLYRTGWIYAVSILL